MGSFEEKAGSIKLFLPGFDSDPYINIILTTANITQKKKKKIEKKGKRKILKKKKNTCKSRKTEMSH